jgi:hypothetical protein
VEALAERVLLLAQVLAVLVVVVEVNGQMLEVQTVILAVLQLQAKDLEVETEFLIQEILTPPLQVAVALLLLEQTALRTLLETAETELLQLLLEHQ